MLSNYHWEYVLGTVSIFTESNEMELTGYCCVICSISTHLKISLFMQEISKLHTIKIYITLCYQLTLQLYLLLGFIFILFPYTLSK